MPDPVDEDLELDPPEGEESEVVDQQVVDEEADENVPEGDEVDGEDRQPDQDVAARAAAESQQPSRGESRQRALANELREARQREADLNRRLDLLIQGQQPRQPQGETPEARANRLALMSPEERITAELNDAKQGFAREMLQTRLQLQESSDKAAYQAKATVDPLYKKWEPKVEAELTELRKQGQNVDREKLMYYLIGKSAVEGRQAAKPGQRAEAQRRVSSQRTRPSNSGSDVSANRRSGGGNSLERRLENQSL
jgi:hypothetical protein